MNQKIMTIIITLIAISVILAMVLTGIFFYNQAHIHSMKTTQSIHEELLNDQDRYKSNLIKTFIKNNDVKNVEMLLQSEQFEDYIYSDREANTLIPTIVYSALSNCPEIVILIIRYRPQICCSVRYCDMYGLNKAKDDILKHSKPLTELSLCEICNELYSHENK
ncbi:hypothetical protein AAEX28_14000 [Lentisphaerota bacterium WC36G]|nr:hypothetical protein LJT99_00750 [Lentisphaerae bacterium WC36]